MIIFSFNAFSEGVKDLRPDTTVSHADLYFNVYGWYPAFATQGCPPSGRLNIHIKNPGEKILFGISYEYGTSQYNLRKPDGTIAMTGLIPGFNQPGNIRFMKQAIKGPFPAIGGYTPLEYTVTSIADTGDYYFELVSGVTYHKLWDFQVVSGAHNPPIPADTINGRVWSQSWELQSELYSTPQFNGRFFILSDDGIVTRLKFNQARLGVANIFCNPVGCLNTGNPIIDRRSQEYSTFDSFPGIAHYKIFLNNPDTTVYPSGNFGAITANPVMITDSTYPPCDLHKFIVLQVTKPGTASIELTFPSGAPATNVNIASSVNGGTNFVPWNGLDGTGMPVPDGTFINITASVINGLTHLPIWDQEQNPGGYQVTLVRPNNPGNMVPKLFWDDSNISGSNCPTTVELTGCSQQPQGCHAWSGYDCHDKMVNTWWYGSADTAYGTSYMTAQPQQPVGHDSTRCGPGQVMLYASVPPSCTVDWYDSPTGGILLLAGDTAFLTPYLTNFNTYYAEARNNSSCLSLSRTPVSANILPTYEPTITGPGSVCDESYENLYYTEPGMLNYDWSISQGGIITSGNTNNDSILVEWHTPGSQQVSVTYQGPNLCPVTEPAVMNVVVAAKPDSAGEITGLHDVCAGTAGVLYVVPAVTGAQEYHWTVPQGVVITWGMNNDSITVNFPDYLLTGEISVHASDSCGDGYPSLPFPVRTHLPVVCNAGVPDTLCQDQVYQITSATSANFVHLQWVTSGNGQMTDDTTLTPVYTPAPGETGTITFTLFAYGNTFCGNDTSETFLDLVPAPTVVAGDDQRVCEGRPVMLNGSSAANYSSLHWTTSGSGHFSDSLALQPVYFPGIDDLAAGTVTLVLLAEPIVPCGPVSDTMHVVFDSMPVISAGPGAVTCQGHPVVVVGAQIPENLSMTWTHNGRGTLTGQSTPEPVYTPSMDETGTIMLTLKVFGGNTCSDSALYSSTPVVVYTAPWADLGPDHLIDSFDKDTLVASVKDGSGSYLLEWEPAGQISDTALNTAVTVPLNEETLFQVTVHDKLTGCTATDTITVHLKQNNPEPECIIIYNYITPNGDGMNDTWIIDCMETYPENTVDIFNIWGDLINHFDNYNNSSVVWKGTNVQDKPVPDGTYYYVIRIPGKSAMAGWVYVRS